MQKEVPDELYQRREIRQVGNVCEEWMQKEGIPIYTALAGVEDVKELPRGPWARMGGLGTFIDLEAIRSSGALLYVVEIPAGGSLEPEKHMYNELIYILRGRGLSEVWHKENKRTFEWGEGSLFAMPPNARHRLVNGGREPVLFLAKTNAPIVMNTFRDMDFVFNCDYEFTTSFTGQADYFLATENRYREGAVPIWETNFVPDVRTALLGSMPEKVGPGGVLTFFKMATWESMHSAEWPVGRYQKAHYGDMAGAVLLGLKSNGFALLWEKKYGPHPYQDGHGDKVVKVPWKPGGIYLNGAGPGSWFHNHYNTGPEPARHVALKGQARQRWVEKDRPTFMSFASLREGDYPGLVLEYEDEDPEIRRMFEEECRQNGVEITMEPVVYRTDPFPYTF
ncbi:cupin domain-containing protein [Chloroflexota bacterium]